MDTTAIFFHVKTKSLKPVKVKVKIDFARLGYQQALKNKSPRSKTA